MSAAQRTILCAIKLDGCASGSMFLSSLSAKTKKHKYREKYLFDFDCITR